MQSVTVEKSFVLVLVCFSFLIGISEATYSLPFIHKFSGKAKVKFSQQQGDWPYPEPGSGDYHKFLYHNDAVRHGRMLATIPDSYTFLEGNYSMQIFGGLYYAEIDVGTPEVSFLVALDTGSDLFWLPCECTSCAPSTSPYYEDYHIDKPLNVYSPDSSSTSKPLECGSEECHLYINQCTGRSGQCQYKVNYASVNTSTSGKLVQDVIHLVPNSGKQTPTTAPIVLGCGQVQTGSFLDGGAPDGLIGLGLQDYAVPAALAKSGLVGDSFSMCFDVDGSGRVVFGDFGSSTQKTTPFLPAASGTYETYYLGLLSVEIGAESIPVGESALFDTGTTYTYLNSTYYQAVMASFAKQVTKYERIPTTNEGIQPWELCYMTSDAKVQIPTIDFIFNGNAVFSVSYPLVPMIYTNGTIAGFCVAIMESTANIVGANFMIGHNLVFNREQRILGFENADCYEVETNSTGGPAPRSVSGGPPSDSPPPSSKSTGQPTAPGSTKSPAPPPSTATKTSFSLLALFLSLGLVHLLLQ